VEHAALAEILRPDDGEIIVGALYAFAGEIELTGVETHQDAHVLPGKILDLIHLVEQRERRGKILHARKLRVFNHERRVKLAPRMAVEISAEHFPVLWPAGERDGRTV